MNDQKETMRINVNVEVTPDSLQAVVQNAKAIVGKDQRGVYRVDTADLVSEMISKFLLEKDFEGYVSDTGNYRGLATLKKD
jgi:hypothetical protein